MTAIHNIKSVIDFLVDLALDSLDDVLVAPDDPVLFLDLLLEGDPEVLDGRRNLHLLLVGPVGLAPLLQLLLQAGPGSLDVPDLD